MQGFQQVLTTKEPAKVKAFLRKVNESIEVNKEGRFTVRFDRSKVLAEAGIPDSFSYGDGLRIGNGEGDGARGPSANLHVEAFVYRSPA